MARFRPSGKLLLVDAECLGEAEPGDEVFDEAPAAQVGQMAAPVVPQDKKSGVNAFFGIWPGDETDEELLAAVRAIR